MPANILLPGSVACALVTLCVACDPSASFATGTIGPSAEPAPAAPPLPSLPDASAGAKATAPPTHLPSEWTAPSTGGYLVTMDGPVRTYFDYSTLVARSPWRAGVATVPQLARWDGVSTLSSFRPKAFVPGQSMTPADVAELLPTTGLSARSLYITDNAYGARVSPADATSAIQAALDAARLLARPGHPVDVLVPVGTYDHAGILEVGADVHLRGIGGTLRATHPATAAVHLGGDRSAALFLTLTAQASVRLTTPDSSGIWAGPRSASGIPVHDTLVIGNEIVGVAGAHVLGIAEDGGIWAFNYAHDGFADAFHHTGGSHDCQVVGNRASGPGNRGDDLYAFVGYHADGDPVHHCSCLANWGRNGNARGLAAVGAGFIDFEHNDIAEIRWAGIYVASEQSYDTYGSFSVFATGNQIAFANLAGTHSGLLAYADQPGQTSPSRTFGPVPNAIRDLVVTSNVFANISAGTGGGHAIEVRSSCTGGEVSGNTGSSATAPGVLVAGAGYIVSSNTVVPNGTP